MFMLPGRVVVPVNAVFGGQPGEIMRYGGHGFLAFVRGLAIGDHTLHAHVKGTLEAPRKGSTGPRRSRWCAEVRRNNGPA